MLKIKKNQKEASQRARKEGNWVASLGWKTIASIHTNKQKNFDTTTEIFKNKRYKEKKKIKKRVKKYQWPNQRRIAKKIN